MTSEAIDEIDCCIICHAVEPLFSEYPSLSAKLQERLRYVTGPLPDLELIGTLVNPPGPPSLPEPPKAELSSNPDDLERTMGLQGDFGLGGTSGHDETESPLSDQEPEVSSTGVPQCSCDSPSRSAGKPVSTVSENKYPETLDFDIQTFFVLKLVFQHPLAHVTNEMMMLLVQSPSDWFEICASCRIQVDCGMELVKGLKNEIRNEEHAKWAEELEDILYQLRTKFINSMFQRTAPEDWEFYDLDCYNVNTMDFLATETEAVRYFRRMLHITALPRVMALVNPTAWSTNEAFVEDAELSEYLSQFDNSNMIQEEQQISFESGTDTGLDSTTLNDPSFDIGKLEDQSEYSYLLENSNNEELHSPFESDQSLNTNTDEEDMNTSSTADLQNIDELTMSEDSSEFYYQLENSDFEELQTSFEFNKSLDTETDSEDMDDTSPTERVQNIVTLPLLRKPLTDHCNMV